MEINGIVEIQGFTRIRDLDDGTVFAFCDSDELFIKGYIERGGYLGATDLKDGILYDVKDMNWEDRPVRQIKAVLTIKQSEVL